MAYKILMLGASYGSLLASKLLFGGHSIHLVCLPAEADLINAEGFRVRMPVRGRKDPVVIDSRKLPGKVTAGGAAGVNPADYDLVGLAMQEPQYRVARRARAAGCGRQVQGALHVDHEHAAAALPAAHPGPRLRHAEARLHRRQRCGTASIPTRMTLCSPDPQAIRPPEEKVNVLQVTLPTNFKVARFKDDKLTGILRQLEKDIEAARFDTPEGKIELPVKLKVHDSVFVPLAKWAMLLAGNYRCVTKDGMRTAQEAVHSDLDTSTLGLQLRARPVRQAGRQPGRPRAVREVRRGGAEPGAAGVGGARADQRRAQHRACRQAGAAHRPREGAQPSRRSTRGVALVDRRLEANRKKLAAA